MASKQPHAQRREAAALAAGYTKSVRVMGIAAIGAFTLLMAGLSRRLASPSLDHLWVVPVALSTGYLTADALSGLVHWMADTWGRVDTPLLGPVVIRSFREHHLDPLAITRHDFVETNGTSCLPCIPIAAAALLVPVQGPVSAFLLGWLFWTLLWLLGTNQFHKWAHEPHPPRVVALLQRCRVILPPAHHARHHRSPFHSCYCITAGCLNRPVDALGIPRLGERLASALLGAAPRAEDLGAGRTGGSDLASEPDRAARTGA